MDEKKYQPTSQEVKDAEEAMTREQSDRSMERDLVENKGEAARTLLDFKQQYEQRIKEYLKERIDKGDMSAQEINGLDKQHDFIIFFRMLPQEYPKESAYPGATPELKEGWTELAYVNGWQLSKDGFGAYYVFRSPEGKLYGHFVD